MYYSDEIIEEVRAANDIVDVVSGYVHLKKQGANYFGLCPFHNEKSPSFSVSADKQIFHCFGCGAGGNVISFVMKYENASFQEAVKSLADRAGIKLPEAEMTGEARRAQERRQALFDIQKEAATYYYRLLRSDKGVVGMKYLTGRGLTRETMKSFGLGYAEGSGNDLTRHLKAKGFSDELILASGMAAYDEKRGLHDKFWNRVIFPIQDLNQRVIGFGGRVMGDGKPKYLNSPETEIFDKGRNLYGLHLAKRSRASYFILCEGYMDVIAMHQAGYPMAVASLGTSFTGGQAALLKRYAKQVLLAYDSDGAGVKAALRNLEILREAGLSAKVIDLRPYKDPDEFMKGAGSEAFAERIRTAENGFFYTVRQSESEFEMDDPAGRTEFLRFVSKRIAQWTQDPIERSSYVDAVAAKYHVDPEDLRKQTESYADAPPDRRSALRSGYDRKPQGPVSARGSDEEFRPVRPAPDPGMGQGAPEVRRPPRSITKEELAARRDAALLLSWLSEQPSLYAQIRDHISPADMPPGVPVRTAELLFEQLKEGRADPGAVIGHFETEAEQQEAAAFFSTDLDRFISGEDRAKAFHDVVYAIKREAVRRDGLADPAAMDREEQLLQANRAIQNKKKLQELAKAVFRVPERPAK